MFRYQENGEFPLVKALERQTKQVRYRFHVPAHTADTSSYKGYDHDLTELTGLDNLFKPTGVIAESQNLSAQFFGAEETYYLVNGSSSGLIAAIWSFCRPGDKVVVSRNVHRSVITGLIWSGAVPYFVPVMDYFKGIPLNVNVETTESVLACGECFKALIVTSPSYWGISPDLDAIRHLAGQRDIPIVVDEAHGGHFVFHDEFPRSAASCAADIWVNSAHKTLGALTPGALLHKLGDRTDIQRLKCALSMLQTSSPSYPVLASLDLVRQEHISNWGDVIRLGLYARRQIKGIRGFSCLETEDLPKNFSLDPLRLTVFTREISLSGFETGVLLRDRYGIEVEITGFDFFVAVIHRGHSMRDIDALIKALSNIGGDYYKGCASMCYNESYPLPELVLSPRKAAESRWREVPLEEACGCVSAVMVSPFPPGIPVLIPGEIIGEETVERIKEDYLNGYFFLGLGEGHSLPIMVVD